MNWQIGQKIAVITTYRNDTLWDQNEERVIVNRSADGKVLLVDKPLQFYHYGGKEYQAEVILISRNIRIEGLLIFDLFLSFFFF